MLTRTFDLFSQEFFDDPYKIYRRMRAEAPVYYSEQYDFYALTRHEDVAAAFKAPRPTRRPTESTCPWCDPVGRLRT